MFVIASFGTLLIKIVSSWINEKIFEVDQREERIKSMLRVRDKEEL